MNENVEMLLSQANLQIMRSDPGSGMPAGSRPESGISALGRSRGSESLRIESASSAAEGHLLPPLPPNKLQGVGGGGQGSEGRVEIILPNLIKICEFTIN